MLKTTIAQDFLSKGYVICDICDLDVFSNLQDAMTHEINVALGNANVGELEQVHQHIPHHDINRVRLHVYKTLNARPHFIEEYYSMFKPAVDALLGTELASQNKINLNIQMPNDPTSLLGLHTDTVSGQSEFEIVAWLPFTRTYDSNSMYIFDFKTSQKMLSLLPNYQKKGMEQLYLDWKDKSLAITLKPGQGLIFSSALMHGNLLNQTPTTRISLNTRFKSLFSPYNTIEHSEKKLGNFYRPLRISPVTKLALQYQEPESEF